MAIVKNINILLLLLVISGNNSALFAQQDFFISISNSRSRAIAMGGAFTAIEDDIGAISFNPAAFDLQDVRSGIRYSIHLNPILPIVSYRQSDNFSFTENDGLESVLGGLIYLVKSVTFSTRLFNFGVLFNEEKIFKREGEKFFNSDLFEDNIYHTVVANIKLSSQVSLGISGSLIRNTEDAVVSRGRSLSYGILIKPNNWYRVGIMYYAFSKDIGNFRRRFDRLANESINAGLAIFPWRNVAFTVDARNLTESSSSERFALQEFHFGFEVANIKHISLRGGYYREKDANNKFSNIFSAGIGLLDLNRFRSIGNRYNHPTPFVSYTILFENTPGEHFRWHMLTIGFRI